MRITAGVMHTSPNMSSRAQVRTLCQNSSTGSPVTSRNRAARVAVTSATTTAIDTSQSTSPGVPSRTAPVRRSSATSTQISTAMPTPTPKLSNSGVPS